MFQVIFSIHIGLCLLLIGLVLLQQGKGADAGAIVGGGSDSVFGAGSAGTFASRLTTGLAIAFMITSILLVKLYQERAFVVAPSAEASSPLKGSILDGVEETAKPVAMEDTANTAETKAEVIDSKTSEKVEDTDKGPSKK